MGLTGNGITEEGFLELGEAFPSLTLSIAIAVSVILYLPVHFGARGVGGAELALGNAVRWNCCRILRLQLSFHAWVPCSFAADRQWANYDLGGKKELSSLHFDCFV